MLIIVPNSDKGKDLGLLLLLADALLDHSVLAPRYSWPEKQLAAGWRELREELAFCGIILHLVLSGFETSLSK